MLSWGERFSLEGELGSRPCQNNMRGEVVLLYGDDVDGDDSCLDKLFCELSATSAVTTMVGGHLLEEN